MKRLFLPSKKKQNSRKPLLNNHLFVDKFNMNILYKKFIYRQTVRCCLSLLFLLLFTFPSHAQLNKKAARALIQRVIPQKASHFMVKYIPKENGHDVFGLASKDGKIVLQGDNGVAVASALNYYLEHFCHSQITWNGTNLNLPHPLPSVSEKIQKTTPYKYRYYLNYTTFNYTMAWWDWAQWQKQIDWMALNGINMPLALTGEAAIWEKVYESMGFTRDELKNFFSGPAYFAWFWMGNLDGWGGPLPQHWMDTHKTLQKKILARERSLGMKPVLPAFTGHVPPDFKKRFPNAKLRKTNWGIGFKDVNILSPSDSLFNTIGKKFIKAQTKEYGTNHLYSADTFNENKPPSKDSLYLDGMSKKVYQSMADADPKAVWVMQGWMFFFDAPFWGSTQIQALLGAVPDTSMIILDLNSSVAPQWRRTKAYYGKQWIWCLLNNGGGNLNLSGKFDSVAHNPSKVLHNPASGKMVGIGLTPEGININPVLFQLMLSNVWRHKPINTSKWLKRYTLDRYGKSSPLINNAWRILKNEVYKANAMGGEKSIICARPTFKKSLRIVNTKLPYKRGTLLKPWRLFIQASDSLKNSDGFQYDLVDITRQVLANYATPLQQKFVQAYKNHNKKKFDEYSRKFLALISDMDNLLATRKAFLLGPWLADARSWGITKKEKDLYEFNARDLITLWGGKNSPIHEYASKQWSGLLDGFYKPRWEMFFNYVDSCMKNNKPVNMDAFDKKVKNWEWQWVHQHKKYPVEPSGNSVAIAKEMYKKYYARIANAYGVNGVQKK
jgi:alpha-N-acetylglucosaminidase